MASKKLSVEPSGKIVGFCDASFYQEGKVAGLGGICYQGETKLFHYSERVDFAKTSNQAEYYSIAILLNLCMDLEIKRMTVYCDSLIAVSQLNGLYSVNEPELIKLYTYVKSLMKNFTRVDLIHTYREGNRQADYYAGIASGKHPEHKKLPAASYFWLPGQRGRTPVGVQAGKRGNYKSDDQDSVSGGVQRRIKNT